MKALLHSFFVLLATATDPVMAQYLEYSKAENRILRSKLPARITITPAERERLVKLGKPLGKAIKNLITIVLRWANGETSTGADRAPAKRGRPPTPVKWPRSRRISVRRLTEMPWPACQTRSGERR